LGCHIWAEYYAEHQAHGDAAIVGPIMFVDRIADTATEEVAEQD
jgi:hypothetical protein